MRTRWYLAIVLSFSAPYLFSRTEHCSNNFSGQSDPRVVNARVIANLLDQNLVKEHLEFLTGKQAIVFTHLIPDRKSAGNKELARLYLVSYLERLGLEVKHEHFMGGINFVAEIPGTTSPEEIFEITAHYDSQGTDVPGADDNGSGLATVLEAARIFSQHRPAKTLRLTLMDLEEVGCQGSEAHAKKLNEEFLVNPTTKKKFLGSLVVDMIGYNPESGPQKVVLELGKVGMYKSSPSYSWSNSSDTPQAAKVFTAEGAYAASLACAEQACYQFLRFSKENIRDEKLSLSVETDRAMPSTGDHGSYWEESLPALFLAAPYRHPFINPYNHRSGDTIGAMNWSYFTRVMSLAIEITANIIEANPQLDKTNLSELQTLVAAKENKNIVRAEQLVSQLTPPPEPVYQSPSKASYDDLFSEKIKKLEISLKGPDKKRMYLILEQGLKGADYGDIKSDEINNHYTKRETEIKAVVTAFIKAKRPILIRKNSDINTYADIRTLAKWMMTLADSDDFTKEFPPLAVYWHLDIPKGYSPPKAKGKRKTKKQNSSFIAGIIESIFGSEKPADDSDNFID